MGASLYEKKRKLWLDNITAASGDLLDGILRQKEKEQNPELAMMDPGFKPQDYSFGWQIVIEVYAMKPELRGLLLTGPEGCGKHTASDIFVNRLATDPQPYEVLFLGSRDFRFSEKDIAAFEAGREKLIEAIRPEDDEPAVINDDIVHDYLDTLLNVYYDQGKNLCLVLEGVSESDFAQAVFCRLADYLRMYAKQEDFPGLKVIIIEKSDASLPTVLKTQLRHLRIGLPDVNKRYQFLANAGIPEELVSSVAERTEGLNFTQLRDLKESLLAVGTVAAEEYEQILLSQLPEPDPAELYQMEKLQLFVKLRELAEHFPEILSGMGTVPLAAVPVVEQTNSTQVQAQEEDDGLSFAERKQQLENQQKQAEDSIAEECKTIAFGELMGSVFGQERMKRMNIQ